MSLWHHLHYCTNQTIHTCFNTSRHVIWNRFIDNCKACYIPNADITVEEQLFPTKSRYPFTQYIASKPDKFGIKFWLAVDSKSTYLLNGFPYVGKDDHRLATQSMPGHVVMKLIEPFAGKGRNVTTDNFLTSLRLSVELKAKNTSIVGTKNRIRREIHNEKSIVLDNYIEESEHKFDSIPMQAFEERFAFEHCT